MTDKAEVTRHRKMVDIAVQHLAAVVVISAIGVPLAYVTQSWILVAVELVLLAGTLAGETIRLRKLSGQGDGGEGSVQFLHYDRQGNPIGLKEWAAKFEDADYKTVAQHWVRGWMVFTTWHGLDYSFGGSSAPPLIFETMVFPPGDEAGEAGAMADVYCGRYSTEESARDGHDQALAWTVEKIGDPAAAMEIMSAAQFSDPAVAPDDPGELG